MSSTSSFVTVLSRLVEATSEGWGVGMGRAEVDLRVALAVCFPLRFEVDFASEAAFRVLGARVGGPDTPVMRSIWSELSPGGGSKFAVISPSAFSFPFDDFGMSVTS